MDLVRHIGLVALLAVVCAPSRAATQTMPAPPSPAGGQLIERLVSRSDSTQAYALFLPAAYTDTLRWPVLFVLDPRGRALLPLGRLRAVANDRGYVIMSSYNSLSDGPFEPNILAMNAMLADAQATLAIDTRRLYIAGFSGTARAAWLFARELGDRVPGIIGTGAGIDRSFFRDDSARRPTLSFYGAIGGHDFNYDEMRELDARLDTLGMRHRVTYFHGGHSWPPDSVLSAAVEWLDLDAMRRGLRPYDSTWVAGLAERALASAAAIERTGAVIDALDAYRAIVADFGALPAAQPAAARAAELESRADARTGMEQRAEIARVSERYRATLDLAMGQLHRPGAVPRASDVARLLAIDSLEREAARGPGERSDLARRLLEYAFVVSSFYQPRHFIERDDAERAMVSLEIAQMIDRDSPRICLFRAQAYALRQRVADSVRELECARRGGALSEPALAHRAFDRVRQRPEFRAFVDSLGGVPDRRP